MTDLPQGWVKATLGEIAETALGKMLDRKSGSGQHLKPYLRNVNVQWGRIDQSDILSMDIPSEQEERFGLQQGDLLVCEGGEVGRCAIWSGGDSYMGYQKALHRVRPLGGIDPHYLLYLLEHLSLRKVLLAYSTGSTIKHLPQEQLRILPIPLPPLAEQNRIVAALEGCLSRLDVGISLIRRSEARQANLAEALAVEATTGKRSGDGLLSSRVDRWEAKSIGELAEVGTGATPSRSRRDYYESGSIPWVTSGAVNEPFIDSAAEFITPKALAETSVKLWPIGTLLMAMYGEGKTRGKCSELRIEAATNQACAAIMMRPEWRECKDWVKLVLQAAYERNRKMAAGGVQPNLNLGLVRSIKIPLPPVEEQRTILANFQGRQSVISAVSSSLVAARQRAAQLRASLLAEAFAGRLVPQDPNDEPASELLARIRAERQAALPKQKARSPRTRKDLAAPPTRVTGDDYQQETLPL